MTRKHLQSALAASTCSLLLIAMAGSAWASATSGTAPAAGAEAGAAEKANAFLDNLVAVGDRLIELPAVLLLLIALGITVAVVMALGFLFRKKIRHTSGTATAFTMRHWYTRAATLAALLLAFFATVYIMDRKVTRLQDEVRELRTQSNADRLTLLRTLPTRTASATPPASMPSPAAAASTATPLAATPPTTSSSSQNTRRQSFLFDPVAAHKSLAATFGNVTVRPLIYDEASDIAQVHCENPLAQAYLAVVDLTAPGVEINLGTNLQAKTLTSQFAHDIDCTIAINGEAGASPGPNSGLGPWRGNMIAQGKTILQEEANAIHRPWLAFDRQSRAHFISSAATDRKPTADAYNVIWGRLDSLIAGTVQTADAGGRQPRTAMAINADGTRLYLMVVDGRQPRYSMGFTRAEVGQFLKAFGATDGLLCDEGGSSCMVLKAFGGLANFPSDNQGQERPTYTHFGIAIRSPHP